MQHPSGAIAQPLSVAAGLTSIVPTRLPAASQATRAVEDSPAYERISGGPTRIVDTISGTDSVATTATGVAGLRVLWGLGVAPISAVAQPVAASVTRQATESRAAPFTTRGTR
jgi:hypothetical protein